MRRLFKGTDSVAESSKDVCFHYAGVGSIGFSIADMIPYRYRWYRPIPDTEYWYRSKPNIYDPSWTLVGETCSRSVILSLCADGQMHTV